MLFLGRLMLLFVYFGITENRLLLQKYTLFSNILYLNMQSKAQN